MDIGFAYNGVVPDLGSFESTYGALPVELLSFNTSVDKSSNVLLDWQVVNQLQNTGWDIERNQLLNGKNQVLLQEITIAS